MAYTSTNSVLRAKRLQDLCESSHLSALIFILGIDSGRNRLDEQLFFWLFRGTSGKETLNSVSLPLNYEEIAWVVTPNSCHIYVGSACNSVEDTFSIHSQVQEISASWTGVDVTTVTKEEVLDSELAENTKLLWFNRTMSRIQGPVGVCSSEIETWPLIQGYAIDLFGLGFFSMSHPPHNISEALRPLFLEFDDACILAVMNEHLPRLCGVFQQTIDFVNKRNYSAGRGELSESQISECVELPFEYATIQSTKQHPVQPYVKLWTYGSLQKVQNSHHLTCVGVCGITGLIAARSWFFINAGAAKEFLSSNEEESDFIGLIKVYKAIVSAVRLGLVKGGSDLKDQILFELYKEKSLMKYHHMLDAIRSAKLDFYSFDADGNTLAYNEDLPLHSVVFTASSIASKDFGNLGDLVFGESFVKKEGKVTIITSNINDFVLWESQTKKPAQSPFGEKLSTIEHAEIFFENLGVYEGTLLVYENGWAFRSIHLGQIEYNIEEFFKIEQHTSDLISFFTETLQLVLKVPNRSAQVLSSIWKIESTEYPAPEFPETKNVQVSLHADLYEEKNDHKVPVFLVIGVAGSGKTKAAKDIARGLKIDCISAPAFHGAHFDKQFWTEACANIQKPTVVVLPSYCVPHYFLQVMSPHIYVKTVVAKVCAKNFYIDKRKNIIPGLVHCVQSCNSLIFEENDNNEILKICNLMNPDTQVFKISGTIGPQQARNITNVNKPVPTQYPYKPVSMLRSVFVKIPLPLVESKIKQKLANSEITDEGALAKRISWYNDMEIIRVKGCVAIHNKEDSYYEISGNSRYFQSLLSNTDDPGILFVGRNLDLNKIYDFVLDARSHVSKLPLKTRNLVSQQEIENIEASLEENSDYIFDGICFVDSNGKKFKKHPDLENAILEYVDQENDKIGKINRSIEKERSIIKKVNADTVIYDIFE